MTKYPTAPAMTARMTTPYLPRLSSTVGLGSDGCGVLARGAVSPRAKPPVSGSGCRGRAGAAGGGAAGELGRLIDARVGTAGDGAAGRARGTGGGVGGSSRRDDGGGAGRAGAGACPWSMRAEGVVAGGV